MILKVIQELLANCSFDGVFVAKQSLLWIFFFLHCTFWIEKKCFSAAVFFAFVFPVPA